MDRRRWVRSVASSGVLGPVRRPAVRCWMWSPVTADLSDFLHFPLRRSSTESSSCSRSNREVTTESAPGLFGVGILCGLALMASAIYQGQCCASAIVATKTKPEVFGLSAAPAAIVEGFAVFAFIFALVIAGGIPNSGG